MDKGDIGGVPVICLCFGQVASRGQCHQGSACEAGRFYPVQEPQEAV